MTVAFLVPRRADGGPRDRLWTFTRPHWEQLGWPVLVGEHTADEGLFNRSKALNRAAAQADPSVDVFVILDSDVIASLDQARDAVEHARVEQQLTCGFSVWNGVGREGTSRILRGYRGNWRPFVAKRFHDSASCLVAVRRDVWDEAGGFDETFEGWGWEDVAFCIAVEALSGKPLHRVYGDLFHLWHPQSPGHVPTHPEWIANRERVQAYIDARRDRAAMLELIRARRGGS